MIVAFHRAGVVRLWCRTVTTSQKDNMLFVHLPCDCYVAVREGGPGVHHDDYAAAVLPKNIGRHRGARFSERRIKAKDIYDATAKAISQGRSNCIVKARQELARHQRHEELAGK